MSTKQSYVEGDNYAIPAPSVCRGHLYRTKVFLLVVKTAQQSGLPESEVWKNVYARLESHYGIYLASFPRKSKESLLRLAERYDLLDKVMASAQAECALTEL